MEANLYDNEDALIADYSKLHKFLDSEDALESQPSDNLLAQLKQIESGIQTLGLFSPNEDYEEIREELVALVDLPYLIALALNKEPGVDRRTQLTRSENYYNIFIELCKHFRILPKTVEKVFKDLKESKVYRIERDLKIASYKDEKQLKDELGKFKQGGREKALINTQLNCYKTINNLLFIPQEFEILAFKDKLNTDQDFKVKYETERATPPEKLKFFKLEKQDETTTINSADLRDANPRFHAKQDIVDTLFQHSYAQPVMTLDEHDDLEYELMMAKQRKNEEGQMRFKEEMDKLGVKNPDDSDEDIVSEMKTYKDRAWDDWKDENEKGAGNRGGR